MHTPICKDLLFGYVYILACTYSYDDQLRIEYIVGCDEEEMAFFNVTTLDLQGAEDCEDENGNFR